jgi:hypothetical protein
VDTKPSTAKQRQLIAIGCAKLAIDRRETLLERYGKPSSSDLTYAQAEEMVAYLRAQGGLWANKEYPGRPKNMSPGKSRRRAGMSGGHDCQGYFEKIEAYLAEAGRPWKYVDAMALRMFGVHKVQWLDADQLRSLMLALKYDARRHGRDEYPS